MSKYSNDDIEQRIKNANEFRERIQGSNKLDLSSYYAELEEEAKAEEQDRYNKSKEVQAREEAQRQKKRDEVQKLINATAKSIEQKNKAKADKEIEEAKAKAEKELDQAINKKHGVKSKEELEKDNAYKALLKGLMKE